jgi:purine/pyrimidine-nucleoside phosphorylase
MTTEHIDNIRVTTKANVYFDGKCISHGITLADGTKKSVGVVLPAALTFNTGAAEIMECVAGACEYKLAGTDVWRRSTAGESFSVPANSSFDIRVISADGAYHYICHFG